MTLSDFRRVTDELLSAYIDDEVNEEERALVEAAIAQDEEIAWRLNSLRQTVVLLRDLPELALPRSFTLSFEQMNLAQAEAQLAGVGMTEGEAIALPAAPRVQPKAAPSQVQAGFWAQITESWRGFWQAGNPILRNAAAVSFALMLMLVGGAPLVNRAMQPVGMLATAPEAAPAAAPAQESAGESVALAQPTTEPTTASLQVQEDAAANKAPVEEPAAENARAMQAPTSPAGETGSAQSIPEAATESSAESESEVQAGEAAVAEAAPAAQSAPAAETPAAETPAEEAPAGEAAAASILAAPGQPAPGDEMPPLVEQPFPGGGAGGAGGMGGGGGDGPPGAGGGGETGDLVPETAYHFDVDPLGQPTLVPAEEAVTASVAAASAAEAPAETSQASAADVAVTPAVEAPAAAAASRTAVDEAQATPATDRGEAPTAEAVVESGEQAEDEPAAEPAVEPSGELTVGEPTLQPTPAEVAVVGPEAITSSDVIEVVETDDAVTVTSPGANLPVLWIAQGSALLLTVLLASLWWRSRGTPRLTSRRRRE